MFKSFSICHIKAETPLGTILPPVPNFLSARHTVVPHQLCFMWFLPFLLLAKFTSVSPHCMVSLLQHRHNNQRRDGDILNPLSQTHDAMLQQFTPSLTQLRNYHLKERAEQPSPQHQGMKEGFVVLIRVNGWEKKAWGSDTVISYVCCPRGEGHIEVFLCLLQGPRPSV